MHLATSFIHGAEHTWKLPSFIHGAEKTNQKQKNKQINKGIQQLSDALEMLFKLMKVSAATPLAGKPVKCGNCQKGFNCPKSQSPMGQVDSFTNSITSGTLSFWYPFGGWYHTNAHGWLCKRPPRFINGIYWEAVYV